MEKNTVIIIAIGMLIGGFGLGYQMNGDQNIKNGHMMPGGSMMEGESTMNMSEMMDHMNAELEGKTGDSFDQAFLAEMIIHHQGAVEMAQLALTNAKHQEIKDLANEIISAQNNEIAEMKSWQKSWYSN